MARAPPLYTHHPSPKFSKPKGLHPVTCGSPTPADAEPCGRIIFEAFRGIATQHNFPLDFPNVEIATQQARDLIANPNVFGVVAEQDAGRRIGFQNS